jgi:acyl dehydratase
MGLYFEDFSVGNRHSSPRRTITETDIVLFAGLSGDNNPLHTDEVFARSTALGARIAHGALIFSIATGLSARIGYFDGTAIAFASIDEWRFLKPVFINDTIFLRTIVTEVRASRTKPDRGLIQRRMEVVNQQDDIVQSGLTSVMVRTRAGSNNEG